jgi:hypothetical protein
VPVPEGNTEPVNLPVADETEPEHSDQQQEAEEPEPPPPPGDDRKIVITGGTADQRGEINDSLEYLRVQSDLIAAELAQYEGQGEGPTLTIQILEDATFDALYKKDGAKNPLGVTVNNGEIATGLGKDANDPSGYNANVRIVIKASAIDVKTERSDRRKNRESQLEGILGHEIGHGKDIRTDPRGFSAKSSADKSLDYHKRRNEISADAFLKAVTAQRVANIGLKNIRSNLRFP